MKLDERDFLVHDFQMHEDSYTLSVSTTDLSSSAGIQVHRDSSIQVVEQLEDVLEWPSRGLNLTKVDRTTFRFPTSNFSSRPAQNIYFTSPENGDMICKPTIYKNLAVGIGNVRRGG